MNEELRLYTFTHFMLSPIQQGIQPGHALGDLMLEGALGDSNGSEMLYDWAENHKTMICLNGGNSKSLKEHYSFIDSKDNPFPYCKFHEDEDSMEGIMTSIAIVLPARIFNTAGLLRGRVMPEGVTYTHDKLLDEHRFAFTEDGVVSVDTFTPWEFELMQRLNGCGLAR